MQPLCITVKVGMIVGGQLQLPLHKGGIQGLEGRMVKMVRYQDTKLSLVSRVMLEALTVASSRGAGGGCITRAPTFPTRNHKRVHTAVQSPCIDLVQKWAGGG